MNIDALLTILLKPLGCVMFFPTKNTGLVAGAAIRLGRDSPPTVCKSTSRQRVA